MLNEIETPPVEPLKCIRTKHRSEKSTCWSSCGDADDDGDGDGDDDDDDDDDEDGDGDPTQEKIVKMVVPIWNSGKSRNIWTRTKFPRMLFCV